MKTLSLLLCLLALGHSTLASANESIENSEIKNMADELDPFDPNIEQTLEIYDSIYEEETGLSARIGGEFEFNEFSELTSCRQITCKVWARVSKSEQQLYLYVDGMQQAVWPVSTGINGRNTPNFETHPNGRIYDRYTSKKFPGGDFNGLGNMPYAVFISGGFAIHGTAKSNWKNLGRKASHGCVRLHPDNGFTFNRLVRANGIANVWISVQE